MRCEIKLQQLGLLEYCYRWMGKWLLEKWSHRVCHTVLILIFLCCQGKGYGKKQTFGCHYYPLLQSQLERWDANNHQIKFCSVTKYHIYITEAGSKDLGYYFLLSLSLRSLRKTSAWHPCGNNQFAMEHNLFQLKYQSLLKHPSTRLDKHVVDKKI
jgi:hypothetical protein